jgi:hypothetical protein
MVYIAPAAMIGRVVEHIVDILDGRVRDRCVKQIALDELD